MDPIDSNYYVHYENFYMGGVENAGKELGENGSEGRGSFNGRLGWQRSVGSILYSIDDIKNVICDDVFVFYLPLQFIYPLFQIQVLYGEGNGCPSALNFSSPRGLLKRK